MPGFGETTYLMKEEKGAFQRPSWVKLRSACYTAPETMLCAKA